MPPAPPDDEETRLFGEAVTLAIRLQGADGRESALAALEAWRRRSPLHARIWAEVAEIQGMAGQVMGQAPPPAVSRRTLLGLGLGAAALGAGFGPGLVMQARADHATGTAEIREVLLPDGSRLTLGPGSAVAQTFGGGLRRLRLLQGMIYCDTAPVPALPPMELLAGPVVLTTAAAAISLSTEGGSLSIALDRGHADLGGTPLAAGDSLHIEAPGAPATRSRLPPGEAAGWRGGLIVARDEALGTMVARIARWLPGRVVLATPALARRRVAGVFDMRAPLVALAAAVGPHGGRVRQVTPLLTLVTTI